MKIENIEKYLSGDKLIGDDYNEMEISCWYEQEKNAYAKLIESNKKKYKYEYHELNKRCGYRFIENSKLNSLRVCGFGSAFGDELKPIESKIKSTVLIDSASTFSERVYSEGTSVVQAISSGVINCKSNSFDLITCLGVLHHIPNVTFVMSELYRCLNSGGPLILREPTTSLGDWRFPRTGVTINERGIPHALFKNIIINTGFEILRYNSCVFPPLALICRKFGIDPYNSKIAVLLDVFFSRIFSWNYKYHRIKFFEKFAPSSDYYVCLKK